MGLGRITIRIHSVFRVIGILIVVLAVLTAVFFYFEYSTQSHLALREAKNAKIAIEMLDKQYYAKDECVYEKTSVYGMSDDSIKQIQELTNKNSIIFLNKFDMEKRKVLGFTYRNKRYEVTYQNDGEEELYKVKRRRSSK